MNVVSREAAEKVGIRELKDQLSRYLSAVRSGSEIIVTDHGRPVARIVPVGERAGVIDELVARGEAVAPRRSARRQPAPIRTRGSVSDLVARQRR